MQRGWIFHEAADTSNFRPLSIEKNTDVVWMGNWGDDERTRELQEFLIEPAAAMPELKLMVHGVRYPDTARAALRGAGIEFGGYLPNLLTPQVYGASAVTLHVPRLPYTNGLSGIPTIRVFEALACGIPLLCSPWTDTEGLFRPGEDYLCVADGHAMKAELRRLLADDAARQQLGMCGLRTIQDRHTCTHRAHELLEICEELGK
jgi:spore maturation protein CgeB